VTVREVTYIIEESRSVYVLNIQPREDFPSRRRDAPFLYLRRCIVRRGSTERKHHEIRRSRRYSSYRILCVRCADHDGVCRHTNRLTDPHRPGSCVPPILGPEASSGYFTIGSTVQLNSATGGAPLFLNVNTTGTNDWKSLSLDATATTETWTLSGDTLVASGQQNFVVCPISGSANFDLYLQTGTAMPSTACTNWITIHLPCLC